MSERETYYITVFDGGEYDCPHDWPPSDSLTAAIAWFQRKAGDIPDEYRSSAQCYIGSESGYEGSHCGHIRIAYERPETDEEMAKRVRDAEAIARTEAELRREDELNELRRLQAKYPEAAR